MKKTSSHKNQRNRPSEAPSYRMGSTRPQKRDIEYMRPEQKKRHSYGVSRAFLIILLSIGVLFLAYLDGSVKIVSQADDTQDAGLSEAVSELERRDEYMNTVESLLGSSWLNGSKISISTGSIQSQLLEDFPELRSARVYTGLFTRSVLLDIELREPRYVLSLTNPSAVNDLRAFIVDEDGYVMAERRVDDKQTVLMERLPMIPIEDQVTSEVAMRERVFNSDTVWFIEEYMRQLKDKEYIVDKIVFPVAANDIHVYVAGEKYYIKLDTSGDVRQQAGAFIATMQDDTTSSPDEYVDVRVSGRVFIK